MISSMIKVCGLHLDNFQAIPYVSETKHAANSAAFSRMVVCYCFLFLVNVYYATSLCAFLGKA